LSDEAPKSAYELAMERLRKQDRDAGVEDKPVTDEQRARVAEVRSVYEAKLAERQILHQAALRKAGHDPAAVEALEEEYRREIERLSSERERKVEAARQAG
jgi:hypothetical protein